MSSICMASARLGRAAFVRSGSRLGLPHAHARGHLHGAASGSPKRPKKIQPLDSSSTSQTTQSAVDAMRLRYPRFRATDRVTLSKFRETYNHLRSEDGPSADVVTVAGRVTSRRHSSSKLIFFDIESEGVWLQVVASRAQFEEGSFPVCAAIRKGDVVSFRGKPKRTPSGELSLFCASAEILAPCLHHVPEVLENPEVRFRNRHLDMLVNSHVRRNLVLRRNVIAGVRQFLDARGFVEVETPVLWPSYGGANARPFVTHSHSLGKMPLTLRISPELFLKQLVIGGMERVYELGKQFRNEGIDVTHNPEFTTCEYYEAYADFESIVTNTEAMLLSIVTAANSGSAVVQAEGSEINFTPPFRRISLVDELHRILGVPPAQQSGSVLHNALSQALPRLKVSFPQPCTTAAMLDALVGEVIEPDLVQPTFLVDYPAILSPLAKSHEETPNVTARFELFVNGRELCNAYVELNDPIEQRRRFALQDLARRQGDEEAQIPDESFCSALEYGLPPTAGWGLGIDRLVMLLSQSRTIREVVSFPFMRPLSDAQVEHTRNATNSSPASNDADTQQLKDAQGTHQP